MKLLRLEPGRLQLLALLAFFTLIVTSCWDDKDNPDSPQLDDSQPVMTEGNYDNDRDKDEKFLNEAAMLNRKEILLGELASDKANMADVKELANMIVEDHTTALADLNTLARSESIVITTEQSDKAVNAHHKLSNKSGDDFDKCYVDMMIDNHEEAIMKFEKAAQECKDPEIRTWADNQLPSLRKHLEHSKFCEKKMKEM